MDYSLLVGVAHPDAESKEPEMNSGFLGIHPETKETELYFIGIIDCLTPYNFLKKTAHFFKRFCWKSSQLSTVSPDFYAERFLLFVNGELLWDADNKNTELNKELK